MYLRDKTHLNIFISYMKIKKNMTGYSKKHVLYIKLDVLTLLKKTTRF